MTTFRTTASISLAAVALVFGANFAAAKDKTPAKPDVKPHAAPAAKHAAPAVQPHTPPSSTEKRQHEPLQLAKPPVAYQSGGHGGSNVQGHKLDDAKKPNGFSFGPSKESNVKDAAKIAPEAKKPDGFTYQKIESVKSPRDAASGQATGKTTPPTANKSGSVPTVNAAKGTATLKPGVSLTKPTVRNDAGTRTGGSLFAQGIFDCVKGGFQMLTGNTKEGMKTIDGGITALDKGTNGDPSDNGPKLNPDEGEGEEEEEEEGEGEGGEGK